MVWEDKGTEGETKMSISDSSIRHDVWNSVYTLINTNKNSLITGKIVTVVGGYPDNENSFPLVVINPIIINENNYTVDMTRGTCDKEVIVTLELFTTSNIDLDYLGDSVTNLFRANQISGIVLINVSDSNGIFFSNENKIKQKTISLVFKRR